MAEYLFLHGKIVVDNTRLYEDGAILADEERVLDIFPHASKIKENIKAYKVNLEGRIILPFFEDKHSFTLNKREEDKPMFINSLTAQDYDGIYDLFNGMEFNKEGNGLVNRAFNEDKYVFINPLIMDKSVLKICLKLLKKDKLMFLDNKYEGLKILKELNVPLNDMYAIAGGNEFRLFKDEKDRASLVKGKRSDFVCFDDNMKMVFKFQGVKISV